MDDMLYRLENEEELLSPQLIYYEELIKKNTALAIKMAGSPERLWPHVKSHKTRELIRLQMEMGINHFKCATIMETDMVASCGARHILLAYPLIGPNIPRFLEVTARWPQTHFYVLGDDLDALAQLNVACVGQKRTFDLFVDVNLGMNRTGVPLRELLVFTRKAAAFSHLPLIGFHCYDGHNHESDIDERRASVKSQMAAFGKIREVLRTEGIETPVIICGGSPSFPCHIPEGESYLSPGTLFLWDRGYQKNLPDLRFTPAAALLTRVISHPDTGIFTLDLGYKGIASDPPGERGQLLGIPGAEPLFQSEEHWVWKMPEGKEGERPPVGKVLYVIPTHICPTSALYRAVKVVPSGSRTADKEWEVAARNRD